MRCEKVRNESTSTALVASIAEIVRPIVREEVLAALKDLHPVPDTEPAAQLPGVVDAAAALEAAPNTLLCSRLPQAPARLLEVNQPGAEVGGRATV